MSDKRRGERYACAGITLSYLPASEVCGSEPGGLLRSATIQNMSLHGLAFDVVNHLEPGTKLVVRILDNDGIDDAESLLTEVKWCHRVAEDHFRVGVRIEALPVVADAEIEWLRSFSDATPERRRGLPETVNMVCPGCGAMADFTRTDDAARLSCGECGANWSTASILGFSRRFATDD